MGMRHPETDWRGEFIGKGGNDTLTCPWFRKSFNLPANATTSGIVYLASIGYHELSINGHPASDAVLLPSISYLPKRVLYRTYNVSGLLRPGEENVIGIWASAGWANYRNLDFGLSEVAPLVLARLEVGDSFSVVTDATWKVHESTTRALGGFVGWAPEFFGGEAIDDSKDIPGWDTAAVDATAWDTVQTHSLASLAHVTISNDAMEPTVRESAVPTKSVSLSTATPPVTPKAAQVPTAGSWLVEMEELFTGWFEVANMHGAPGSTVTFHVSTTAGVEVEYNMLDTYTFGPTGIGQFRMRFAYHEIQYISISGLSKKPATADIVGYRLTSLSKRTGGFACSSDLMNKIYATTVNNYRGLTTGGMTVDCPHRERKGYGGDGHTSYQFALANYPVGAYFSKWQVLEVDILVQLVLTPCIFATPPSFHTPLLSPPCATGCATSLTRRECTRNG
jgi:alpha-L-rhamnosidase